MLFKKEVPAIIVTEVILKKNYAFMYENFVVASQRKLFLLLEQTDNIIDTLQFDFLIYKYGYPNDEVSHPLSKFGLGPYGLFKVTNSPWITELKNINRQHHRHSDSLFDKDQHYIAKFKDVTVEIICTKMEETQITKSDLLKILDEQINNLVK
jgi:hypothetical protein